MSPQEASGMSFTSGFLTSVENMGGGGEQLFKNPWGRGLKSIHEGSIGGAYNVVER